MLLARLLTTSGALGFAPDSGCDALKFEALRHSRGVVWEANLSEQDQPNSHVGFCARRAQPPCLVQDRPSALPDLMQDLFFKKSISDDPFAVQVSQRSMTNGEPEAVEEIKRRIRDETGFENFRLRIEGEEDEFSVDDEGALQRLDCASAREDSLPVIVIGVPGDEPVGDHDEGDGGADVGRCLAAEPQAPAAAAVGKL